MLITGASSGIGAAVARRLARRGDDLVLVARGREGLRETARAVEDAGGTALVVPADITDRDGLESAFATGADALGGLDAVIANAGAGSYGLFADTAPEDVDRTIAVTLIGAANTLRTALPHLERTGGTIVLTGSVAAKQPLPLQAAYCAAKHGVRGLAESVRLELRATGSSVRVATVHPGPVDTPFWVHVTPARGMPPDAPSQLAADPDRIARALVGTIDRPRPEQVVGWTMKALGLVPRPLRDLVMTRVVRYALDHAGDDEPGRAIWHASGTGERTALAQR